MTSQTRLRIYKRDGYKCKKCGTGSDLTIDHIIPVSKGGTNVDTNLRTMCRRCNEHRGNYTAKWWRALFWFLYTHREAAALKNELRLELSTRAGSIKKEVSDDMTAKVKTILDNMNALIAQNKREHAQEIQGFTEKLDLEAEKLIDVIHERSLKRDRQIANALQDIFDRLESLENE